MTIRELRQILYHITNQDISVRRLRYELAQCDAQDEEITEN